MNPINVHFSKPLEFLLLAPSGDEGVATSVRLCGSNLSRALNLHLSGSGLSQVSLRLRSQRSHEKKGSLSHWWSWILQPVRNSLESKTACSKAIFIGVKCELHTVKCQADDIRWGVTPDTGQWPPGSGGWSVSPGEINQGSVGTNQRPVYGPAANQRPGINHSSCEYLWRRSFYPSRTQ